MLKIWSNGSKWAGEQPDGIEVLLEVLASEPLRPDFEDYGGGFYYRLDDPQYGYMDETQREAIRGQVRFVGNFAHLSHVFCIDTDEPELIDSLTKAIDTNLASLAYQQAYQEYQEYNQREQERKNQIRQAEEEKLRAEYMRLRAHFN